MKLRFTNKPAPASTASAVPSSSAQNAFTLVEAMCAAAIAAILILALFTGLTSGFKLTQLERENLRATQIALARMEGLRLYAWSSNQLFSPAMLPNTFTEYYYPSNLGGFAGNNTVYTGSVKIANINFTPTASYSPNMQQIVINVGWQDTFYGRTNYHVRTYSTYVAKYGLQNYVFYNP